MKISKEMIIGVLIILCCFLTCWILREKHENNAKPIESYLLDVTDPNWIRDYGIDLESRMIYNVSLLNRIVNRQGKVLEYLLRKQDPNR